MIGVSTESTPSMFTITLWIDNAHKSHSLLHSILNSTSIHLEQGPWTHVVSGFAWRRLIAKSCVLTPDYTTAFPCGNAKEARHKYKKNRFCLYLEYQTTGYVFFSVRILSDLRDHSGFSSPPQRPKTSDFEGFLSQILSITVFVLALFFRMSQYFPF